MITFVRIPTLAALAAVQVLAASCGGGGSGGGSPFSSTLENTFNPNSGTEAATRKLAGAKPREGSVSLSSNFNSGTRVTQDTVEVSNLDGTESSMASVSIKVSGSANVDMTLSAANADEHFEDSTATFVRETGNEVSAVAISVAFDDDPGNTDWAAVGIWFYIADQTSPTPENWNFGVFADISDTLEYGGNPLTLSNSFTYRGSSQGYVLVEYDDGGYDFDFFDATAVLEADFGSSVISGRIEHILDDPNEAAADGENFDIVLEEVTLTNSDFFTGEVKVETESGSEDGDGNWGGLFFGSGAEGVIGTYGGSFNDDDFMELIAPGSELAEVLFAGAFIAAQEVAP